MNDLSILETPDPAENRSSTSTMLTTMILLIASLTLTGGMALQYLTDNESVASTNKPAVTSFLTQYFQGNHEQGSTDQGINSLLTNHDLMSNWPRMKLAGFGKSEEVSGNFAIINGKKVHLGQNVAGKVRLVEIRDHDVIVEYKGKTKILTIEN